MAKPVTLKLERFLFNGVLKYRYIGEAPPGMDDDTPRWEIIRFSYFLENDGSITVSKIQTLDGVKWSERDTLPWN